MDTEPQDSIGSATSSFPWSTFSFDDLIQSSDKFIPVERFSAAQYSNVDLFNKIWEHERTGIPIIISNLHLSDAWDSHLLSPEWLLQNMPETKVTVRNVSRREDDEMTFREYIEYARTTTSKVGDDEAEPLYGKDAPCPPRWGKWLGPEVVPERTLPFGPDDIFWHLEPDERPETLMTYLGIGGTYTPCHKDPCASQGQNLMTYAEPGASSVWFFTASHEAFKVARHFKETYQTELDWEATFLTPNEFLDFPCSVYVCNQGVGDLVLVPRRSCHQVVNFGGLNIKTSWSRMTPLSLREAITDECPIYRRLEVYRTKLLLYRSIINFTTYVNNNQDNPDAEKPVSIATDAIRRLLPYLDQVLVSEWDPNHSTFTRYSGAQIPVCNFCGADIFQSFFECQQCIEPSEGTADEDLAVGAYQICATCYVEGRSCKCVIMQPMQRWSFLDLLTVRNRAAAIVGSSDAWDMTPGWLDNTESNRVFQAAVELRRRRLERKPNAPRIMRCSNPHGDGHNVKWEGNSYCSGCNRGLCHRHCLLLRCSHTSDSILDTRTRHDPKFHAKHIGKRTFSDDPLKPLNEKENYLVVFGRPNHEYREPPRDLQPSLRLTWAAIEFPDCHPIDVGRSKLGFYDVEMFGLDEDSDEADQLANGGTSASISTRGTPIRNQGSRRRVKAEQANGDHTMMTIDGVSVRVGPPKKRKRRNSSPDEPLSQVTPLQRTRSFERSDRPSGSLAVDALLPRGSSHTEPPRARKRPPSKQLDFQDSVEQTDGHDFDDDHDPLALSSPSSPRAELEEEAMPVDPTSQGDDPEVHGVYALLLNDLRGIRAYIPDDNWANLRNRMSELGHLIGVDAESAPESPRQ
ncbi:hypothetical protein FRC01_007886 [Tulasnella sp. 417]|nr:hypothetical protein FRC01_007886 [Tulasnella sp. 417]